MSLLPFKNTADDLFSFAGSVGRFGDNNREDVIKAQALLANAGYYDLPEPGMPTGWPGGELNRALIRFQKDHGLEPDGTLLPLDPSGVTETGVGETVQALQSELSDRLQRFAPPSVQEVDRFYRGWLRSDHPDAEQPRTNVILSSADRGSGEVVGLEPVMRDASPSPVEPKAGQQFALWRDPKRDPVPRFLPDGPLIMGGGGGPRGGGQPAPSQKMTPGRSGSGKDARSPAMPGQTSPSQALPDFDTTRPPEPAQPEEDRQQQDFAKQQRGRIIIAEDGKELHVPPLGAWAKDLSPDDRQIADGLSDAFAIEMAKRPGSRGDEWTQKGVDMYVQGCLEAAKKDLPKLAENLRHIAGGTQDGRGAARLKEEYLANVINGMRARLGSGRSDFTLEFARNVVLRFRANTTTKLADGVTNTGDEQNRVENMDRLTLGNGDYVAEFPKFPKGMGDAEIKKQARKACGEELTKWFEEIAKTGEFEKPAPKEEKEYPGHRILKDLESDIPTRR